jgi:hypothetical protein
VWNLHKIRASALRRCAFGTVSILLFCMQLYIAVVGLVAGVAWIRVPRHGAYNALGVLMFVAVLLPIVVNHACLDWIAPWLLGRSRDARHDCCGVRALHQSLSCRYRNFRGELLMRNTGARGHLANCVLGWLPLTALLQFGLLSELVVTDLPLHTLRFELAIVSATLLCWILSAHQLAVHPLLTVSNTSFACLLDDVVVVVVVCCCTHTRVQQQQHQNRHHHHHYIAGSATTVTVCGDNNRLATRCRKSA